MNPLNNYKKIKLFGNLTTKFGGKTRDENFHPGLDIAAPSGTLIPAFNDGIITSSCFKNDGSGNVVTLKDKEGNSHQYSHLQGALLPVGKKVKQGQSIARMGKSGNSYSKSGGDPSHLDIRIVDAYGRYKNPTNYLTK
jgi:murein DD-endopeptidase MepM/ murein hydrolase activator NlpD